MVACKAGGRSARATAHARNRGVHDVVDQEAGFEGKADPATRRHRCRDGGARGCRSAGERAGADLGRASRAAGRHGMSDRRRRLHRHRRHGSAGPRGGPGPCSRRGARVAVPFAAPSAGGPSSSDLGAGDARSWAAAADITDRELHAAVRGRGGGGASGGVDGVAAVAGAYAGGGHVRAGAGHGVAGHDGRQPHAGLHDLPRRPARTCCAAAAASSRWRRGWPSTAARGRPPTPCRRRRWWR